ncbi:MAG: ABC transporter ATP-binding protein [Fimbriimonadaceae bacterium]
MSHIDLRHITKRFGSFTAIENVDFGAEKGRIHALVGENGAGKTTLMRVLFGALQPDEGEVHIGGEAVRLQSSSDAIARGIGMVNQHDSVIPALPAWRNLILGAEDGPWLNQAAVIERAEALAKPLGFEFDWTAPAATMSPGATQKLEILKLLWRNAETMILDEPTAMLSPVDAEGLYRTLRQLADGGKSIIVVTHRLPEVLEGCDEVTVLRGGKLIESRPVAGLTAPQLAEAIVGRSVEAPELTPPNLGEECLVVENLTLGHSLRDVSFTLRAGELVGLAGVDGNGQRELIRSIMGVLRPDRGTIRLQGQNVTKASTQARLGAGLRLIAEDRYQEAMIASWPLVENAALGQHLRPPFARNGRRDLAATRVAAQAMAERFRTKFVSLDQPIGGLSGGNQQRFIAGRALADGGGVVLAFQPARGLDLAGIDDVYGALRAHTRAGGCALVVSFDLDELLAHCDRIITISHGELRVPAPEQARDREAIGRMMLGEEA